MYYTMKQYAKAVADYNHTLEIDPKYGEAYFGLGEVSQARGKDIDALTYYLKANSIGPAEYF
jgi:tetratricopeptide (TPR) repeat protein